MTMTASELIEKARDEVGVKESPKNSNNVKYNTWYYGHAVSGPAYSWCVVFVAWLFRGTKLFPRDIANCLAQDVMVNQYGGKWILPKTKSKIKRKSALKKYKIGDIACLDFGTMDAVRDHMTIIIGVDGSTVITIEGNTSSDKYGSQSNGGEVCIKKRPYYYICSVARPKYDKESYPGKYPDLTVNGKIKALRKGDKREKQVKRLQLFLKWCGYDIKADGKYGKKTVTAVRRWKRKHGLAGIGSVFGAKALKKAKRVTK